MRGELPADDYKPRARPLADHPRHLVEAVMFSEIAERCGLPEAYQGRIFSEDAVRLAREGRIASGQVGSAGDAIFREGIHPDEGVRFLLFPRPLPRRAHIYLERRELRRFFSA